MRIAFAISNAELVQETWTTTHLACRALEGGHTVLFIEPRDLEITARGQLVARAAIVEQPTPRAALAAALAGRSVPRRYVGLLTCDLLLLRLNPLPESLLNLLLIAEDQGLRMVNPPGGVLRTRSKAWLATLTDVPRPPTLITHSRATARLFAGNLGGPIVVKPVLSSGGRGVTRVDPHALDAVEDAMTRAQDIAPGPVVLQGWLPEATEGEKRLVWMDGEILGGYLRRSPPGDFRHNLRVGGLPEPCEIGPSDRALGAALTPHLLAAGIRIAGLDVIGRQLVEVNTLNPGGVHYAEHFQAPSSLPPVGVEILRRLTARREPFREVRPA